MGLASTPFSIILLLLKKNISLKPLILTKKHFKTNFSFFNFFWGEPSSAKIMVKYEALTSKPSARAIWQLSYVPYYMEFVSGHADHSYFLGARAPL